MAREAFGDPTASSGLTMCMVDTSGAALRLLASLDVPAGAGWAPSATGFNYRALGTAPGKITRVKLTSGNAGKIIAKGWTPKLRPGDLPVVTPVRIYIVRRDSGEGFSADFLETKRNSISRVTARSR
jgi:hypothetical protein